MGSVKDELALIRENTARVTEGAFQLAEDFRDIAAGAEQLLADATRLLADEFRATSDAISDLNSRLGAFQVEIGAAIQRAAALNYLGRVRQAQAVEDLGNKLIAAAVVANQKTPSAEQVLEHNVYGVTCLAARHEVSGAPATFEELLEEARASAGGGAAAKAAMASALTQALQRGLLLERKDAGSVDYRITVNTESEELRRAFPFLNDSTAPVHDLERRLTLLFSR